MKTPDEEPSVVVALPPDDAVVPGAWVVELKTDSSLFPPQASAGTASTAPNAAAPARTDRREIAR
jgi:hypothetical protein